MHCEKVSGISAKYYILAKKWIEHVHNLHKNVITTDDLLSSAFRVHDFVRLFEHCNCRNKNISFDEPRIPVAVYTSSTKWLSTHHAVQSRI